MNILDEGVGHNVGLNGLYIVTMSNSKSTFSISDYHTGKCLLTWHRNQIKLPGCIKSLVFFEVDKTCCGGPGLLWIQHPMPQAMKLQEQLNK